MSWFINCRSNIRLPQFTAIVVIPILVWGCMNPEKAAHFETDLISLNHVLDSVFTTSGQDSVREVSKTIRVTGQDPETHHISSHNVLEDLNSLRDYDIATPRWADYVQTSRRDSAGWQLIRYTLKNKRAPVQRIAFVKRNGNVEGLQVQARKKSAVSEQRVQIDWEPGTGYTIHTNSKLLFRQPYTFTMRVTFDNGVQSE